MCCHTGDPPRSVGGADAAVKGPSMIQIRGRPRKDSDEASTIVHVEIGEAPGLRIATASRPALFT